MKKLIISLVLIFLFSLCSIKIYAIAEDINELKLTTDNTQIVVLQKANSSTGKELVPKGSILGVNDIEEMTFTYTIFIQYGVKVDYTINDIKINNQSISSDISDLFNYEFKVNIPENHHLQLEIFDKTEAGYFMEITVILTMNNPTKTQFEEIRGQQLSFVVIFQSIEKTAPNTM